MHFRVYFANSSGTLMAIVPCFTWGSFAWLRCPRTMCLCDRLDCAALGGLDRADLASSGEVVDAFWGPFHLISQTIIVAP